MTSLELQNQKLMNQERVFKLADFLSKSDIIPKHFQGKPANVFIALEMANRLNIDFFELANGLYVVHGSPGFGGAFTIGRINGSGKFKTKLNFRTKGEGNDMQVTAYAVDLSGESCAATVSMSTAIAEGWTKNTKYKSMPEQMLTYRAATFFCRKHCPEVMLGARTVEEIEDTHAAETIEAPSFVQEIRQIDVKNSRDNDMDKLNKLIKQAKNAGIAMDTINNICKDLSAPSKVSAAIDFLQTVIADKISKPKPISEPKTQAETQEPDPEFIPQAYSKLKRLLIKADEIGIPESALEKVNPESNDLESIKAAISQLNIMIATKLGEK